MVIAGVYIPRGRRCADGIRRMGTAGLETETRVFESSGCIFSKEFFGILCPDLICMTDGDRENGSNVKRFVGLLSSKKDRNPQ